MRILVVDDHLATRQLLVQHLEQAGHTVLAAADGAGALTAIEQARPDVLVLDVMLPDASGIELCRRLRAAAITVPVLLLSARGEVHDRVSGLEAGADDYLTKPFALAEVRARVTALARRGPVLRARARAFGPVTVDLEARRVTNAGRPVPLTATELAIVEVLASRAGRSVHRQELVECVWGESTESAQASLEVLIARIRRKLGDAAAVLKTLRGIGYRFEWDE